MTTRKAFDGAERAILAVMDQVNAAIASTYEALSDSAIAVPSLDERAERMLAAVRSRAFAQALVEAGRAQVLRTREAVATSRALVRKGAARIADAHARVARFEERHRGFGVPD